MTKVVLCELCAVNVVGSRSIQIPRGDESLAPGAIGAEEEVTNPSQPLLQWTGAGGPASRQAEM
jgi:hypothetical protein